MLKLFDCSVTYQCNGGTIKWYEGNCCQFKCMYMHFCEAAAVLELTKVITSNNFSTPPFH